MAKQPDYVIKALDKVTNEKGKIGAAWKNDDGRITIIFDAFVKVSVGKDFVITAFPEKAED